MRHKLSKDQIHFIENYLEHSDIYYADIRMEMTDHVASALEAQIQSGDDRVFYEIFKDYMIEHKSKLLENNKAFVRNVDKLIFRNLLKQLTRPLSTVVFILAFFSIYRALNFVDVQSLRTLISMFPIMSIVPFCIVYVILLKWFKLSRFSGIERLGFVQMIVFQLYNFIIIFLGIHVKESGNNAIVALSLALVLTVSLVMIKLTIMIVNQYRKEYKNLI